MRRSVYWSIIALILTVTTVITFFNFNELENVRAEEKLVTAKAEYSQLVETIGGYGKIWSSKFIDLSVSMPFPVKINKIKVLTGERVHKNQDLILLDKKELLIDLEKEKREYKKLNAEFIAFEKEKDIEQIELNKKIIKFEAELEAMQKALDISMKEYKSALELQSVDHINTLELEEASYNLSLAKAAVIDKEYELLSAKNDLEMIPYTILWKKKEITNNILEVTENIRISEKKIADSTVSSPVDGIITEIKVSQGDFISGSEELIIIADLDHLCFMAEISSDKASYIKDNTSYSITLDDYYYRIFSGNQLFFEDTISQDKNIFNVYTHFTVPDDISIKVGMKGFVRLSSERKSLLIPASAVMNPAGRPAVFLVKNKKIKLTNIVLGLISGDKAEIRKGLQPDDEIVVYGKEKLKDGDSINY